MRALMPAAGLIALIMVALTDYTQAEEMAYCLESPAGVRTCSYQSLERCQQMARAAPGGRCVTNPALSGTTGHGGLDAPRGAGAHSLDRVPAPAK